MSPTILSRVQIQKFQENVEKLDIFEILKKRIPLQRSRLFKFYLCEAIFEFLYLHQNSKLQCNAPETCFQQ